MMTFSRAEKDRGEERFFPEFKGREKMLFSPPSTTHSVLQKKESGLPFSPSLLSSPLAAHPHVYRRERAPRPARRARTINSADGNVGGSGRAPVVSCVSA